MASSCGGGGSALGFWISIVRSIQMVLIQDSDSVQRNNRTRETVRWASARSAIVVTTITKERAAIHEAGHAAMAIISGVPFLKVRIFQNSTGDWIGDCDAFERYGGAVPVEDNERVIAGFLAGTMAERISGYAPPVEREWTRIWAAIKQLGDGPHQGWEDDLLQAIGIVKASYPYATRKDFSTLLASLLSLGWMHADDLLRANSPAVEAIAEGILRFDSLSLSSEEARAIAAASGLGTPVDPDLERLMHARLQAKSSTMT